MIRFVVWDKILQSEREGMFALKNGELWDMHGNHILDPDRFAILKQYPAFSGKSRRHHDKTGEQ
jgi:hypothetical protein